MMFYKIQRFARLVPSVTFIGHTVNETAHLSFEPHAVYIFKESKTHNKS